MRFSIGVLLVINVLLSTSACHSARETNQTDGSKSAALHLRIPVTVIHVNHAEFPLNWRLFELILKLALDDANEYLRQQLTAARWNQTSKWFSGDVQLDLRLRSANTCSRQFAGALAAEEFYKRRTRLFIVSGCDDAVRTVSMMANKWRVPVVTAASFSADLSNKSLHKSLLRVAFSFEAAVDFLFKTLKTFQWRHVNLVVDESDSKNLALRNGIEQHLIALRNSSSSGGGGTNFSVILNPINLDLLSLQSSDLDASPERGQTTRPNRDKWPNEALERAIGDALWRCARFSRVTILLLDQRHLRQFMLSAYDQNMATGQYAFINLPLMLMETDEEAEEEDEDEEEDNGDQPRDRAGAHQMGGPEQTGTRHANRTDRATGAMNEFLWRSPVAGARNLQAKQAFESLMSIYLRTPTTKAYVYLASRLNNLAAELQATSGLNSSRRSHSNRVQLNPYAASFYDSLQIYVRVLHESLAQTWNNSSQVGDIKQARRHHLRQVQEATLAGLSRARRFENMVTGSVAVNENGDRVADFTLDDMNKMTGRFAPVVLYRGESRDIERLGRIHWSSDSSVGPTSDTIDCNLTADGCLSNSRALLAKYAHWVAVLFAPLGLLLGLFFVVHSRLRLESQLVDYWWRIHMSEIETIRTLRKNLHDGSLVTAVSSEANESEVGLERAGTRSSPESSHNRSSSVAKFGASRTQVTRTTDTSGAWSSAADVCYGNISLATYKLMRVALKPIKKFHHSRKLMIELRSLKEMNHSNLCRFFGIIVDEGQLAIVSEFCPKGSLREFFHSESMVIDWTFKYSIINDILSGLSYLHSSSIGFHGRLKSGNCLVSGRFVIKLSDYGPQTLLEQQDDELRAEVDGQTGAGELSQEWLKRRIWLAPEHMAPSRRASGSKQGDVYSFGLLLYEIITNTQPFYSPSKRAFEPPVDVLYEALRSTGPSQELGPDMALIEQLSRAESSDKQAELAAVGGHQVDGAQAPPAGALRPLVELMRACWQFEPSKRPNMGEIHSVLKTITRGVTSKKLLENLTARMEQYTNNLESLVEAKLATLMEEKLKTEELLYQFVPKSIASRLREGQFVEPEAFECVTVFYSDIVGFTSLSSESSPMEVVDFLSNLYQCFDETLEQHDTFKVDTIGDAYIVASGLPLPNDGKHVIEIARTALALRDRLKRFKIPHKPGRSLEMRAGIHSGQCVAGIVGGLQMPKYCVFGDTLTIGKFMESSGLPMRIHITEESRRLLTGVGEFQIEPREPRITRNGLPFQTYWLEGRNTEDGGD